MRRNKGCRQDTTLSRFLECLHMAIAVHRTTRAVLYDPDMLRLWPCSAGQGSMSNKAKNFSLGKSTLICRGRASRRRSG